MATDVVLVALAVLERDARTLNLARALATSGIATTVIAASESDDWSEPFAVMPWIDPGGRVANRMSSLKSFTKSLNLSARVVAGMDLFALGAARACAKAAGAPLVYDMREFYFALGPLAGKGIKQKVVAAYERHMLRHVQEVIVSSALDAKIVTEHFKNISQPSVVMNTPPYKAPVQSKILREKHSIPSDATIAIYQGVVHHGRGLAPFIDAMPLMPDVHLCIVGDGPALDTLAAISTTAGIADRVHWHGTVPYDDLHAVTCSANVGLCLIEPISLSYEYALPNKLFEYMMAQLPVLCTDLPALRSEILSRPVGMLVGRGLKPLEISEAMKQVQVPATAEAMKQACANVRDVSYERQAQYVVDLFRELM